MTAPRYCQFCGGALNLVGNCTAPECGARGVDEATGIEIKTPGRNPDQAQSTPALTADDLLRRVMDEIDACADMPLTLDAWLVKAIEAHLAAR